MSEIKIEELIVTEMMAHLDELKPSQLMCGLVEACPDCRWFGWGLYSPLTAETIWRHGATNELNWSEIAWRVEMERKSESGVRQTRLRKVRNNCLELAGVAP